MQRLTENKIIMITRQTRLEGLLARFNTEAQARFYLERLGADFGDYKEEDRQYRRMAAEAATVLNGLGRLQSVERRQLPNFWFGPDDTVVALGQDGLIANTLKYLEGQPLIGVNPDPLRWDGILLPFQVRDLRSVVMDVFSGRRPVKRVSMARADLQDGQTLPAVNDFFIGQKTHVSARYILQYGEKQENQSSSGIIVSTGLGSTGWMKSVVTGASAIAHCLARDVSTVSPDLHFDWDADYLMFSVREPFPSQNTGADLVFGRVDRNNALKVRSEMPENGVIFSDGIESDCLEFNSGMEAAIGLDQQQGCLVV